MSDTIHATITAALVEAIRAGAETGRLPWRGAERPTKLSDGTPYRGVNVLHLMAVAAVRGYGSGVWGGYAGWHRHGGQVRRREKGTRVLYAAPIIAREEGARTINEEKEHAPRRIVRTHVVFNRDQVDGLEAEWDEPESGSIADGQASARTDVFTRALGATVRHGGTEAAYLPGHDLILMPGRERFIDTETVTADVGYASTLAHELVHWSAPTHRADRACGARGTPEYAREELVAEFGAAFLAPELGFDYCGTSDHAGYLALWLGHLERDERALFAAAAEASRAVRWLQERAAATEEGTRSAADAVDA